MTKNMGFNKALSTEQVKQRSEVRAKALSVIEEFHPTMKLHFEDAVASKKNC